MERKTILELIVVIIVLASIVILTLNVYFTETEPNVRLLAIGIILSAFLGGYNMFKSLFRSAEAEELRKANRLEEQRQKRQYQNAKDQLKNYLEEFVLCCGNSKGGKDKIQEEMSEVGNELKRVVRNIEKQLLLPQDILNEVKAIAGEIITFSKGSGVPVVGAKDLSDLINQQSRGRIAERDKLIERAKEVIDKLQQEEGEDKK